MTVAVKTTLCACAALLAGAGIPALTRPAIAQTNPPQANQSTQTTFDFSGDYAPGQWQVRARNSGGGFQFDGMDAAGTTADSLTLIGSDLGGIDGCLVDTPPDYCAPGFTALYVQVQVPEWSIIQFNWDYTTYDIWQDPAYDPFGYVLPQFNAEGELTEGKFVAITDPDGSPQQSGEFSIELKADSFFALQIGTLDNQFGPAVASITQFSVTSFITNRPPTSVPEPRRAIALPLAGLMLLALRRRRSNHNASR